MYPDLARDEVNGKVPIHDEKQVDQVRIVRDQPSIVRDGIRTPAYLDQPAALTVMRGGLYLDPLDSVRPRYQQVIDGWLYRYGRVASA